MQAQCTNTTTQAITSAQSLLAVQTLLRAGLGCIAYVRNLLPADNFSPSHFTSEDDSVSTELSEGSTPGSGRSSSIRQNINGFKIMTMSRGYTDEADKILNYLEHGIFDAVEKQYLRSFIFGIYLDSNDPNNIVEAYTFNFQYHKIPGTDAVIPVMTLDEGVKNMSLNGRDPVVDAVKGGKPPTLRDVKRSVKRLLKALIHSTNNMEALPKRRFATFKVFYTESTPPEYEPPNFRPGDQKKDKWYFMTHDMDEMPEKWSLGSVETGHHSVDVNVRSVVSYLPSSTENDDSTFAGTISVDNNAHKLTPVQEANARVVEAENQLKDAEQRNIAWAVDGVVVGDEDAEGEEDPEYELGPEGQYVRATPKGPVVPNENVPVGMRSTDGEIIPLARPHHADEGSMDIDEAHFGGISEEVPTHVAQLHPENQLTPGQADPLEQTQPLQDPALLFTPSSNRQTSSTCVPSPSLSPMSDHLDYERTPTPSARKLPTSSIREDADLCGETQVLDDVAFGSENDGDTEMLDMETQVLDPIQSYEDDPQTENIDTTPKGKATKPDRDNGLHCECQIDIENTDQCYCEGGCDNWYHCCYQSAQDQRMPKKFVCFDCRLRGDPNWELIQVDLYPRMISNFRELATFRRAIKFAETINPETESDFIKAMQCGTMEGHRLFKRLKDEGIMTQKIITVDELGLVETTTRSLRSGKGKARGKQNTRKPIQKPRFTFNRAFLTTTEYANYFSPDSKVERTLLNIPQLVQDGRVSTRARLNTPLGTNETLDTGSQTQEAPPLTINTGGGDLKRNHAVQQNGRPSKKVKISLATGVDLAE
ncbi:DNA binding protein [Pleurotus pulmonarius]|nr:DNA binding protein [Pleurotus pulmonarius]